MILDVILGIFGTAISIISVKLYIKLTTGKCKSQVCLKGKTAIVTGANTGIGYETALDFAKRGAKVILACRDEKRAIMAVKRIKEETHNHDVSFKIIDLSSFKSVKQFASEINASEERLDILVNNAGAGGLGEQLTEDGLPKVIQINYFSHFLLTMLLVDLLKKHPSRVVNVSAIGAKLGKININDLTKYQGRVHQYITSKLCQILFTIEFARRYSDTEITAYSLHPGVIKTDIFRNMPLWRQKLVLFVVDIFCKTATEGAQTQIFCATENGLEIYNGQHFHDCHLVKRYKSAMDPNLARCIWEESEKIVGVNE